MPEISRQPRRKREFLTDPKDQRTVLVCVTMVGLALASLGIKTPSEDIDAQHEALSTAQKPSVVTSQYCESLPDTGAPLPANADAKPRRYMMPGVQCLARISMVGNIGRPVGSLSAGETFTAVCLERDEQLLLRVAEQDGAHVTGDVRLGDASINRFVYGAESVPLCDAAAPVHTQQPAPVR